MSKKWVYDFSDFTSFDTADEARRVLGGKGFSLGRMTADNLNVPPGFTIGTHACREFLEGDGRWPDGLLDEIRASVARLEAATGRAFGDAEAPLLVSVRSGAEVSMPGMMDTILNCGMLPVMSERTGSSFWPVFTRFLMDYAESAYGVVGSVMIDAAGCPPEAVVSASQGRRYTEAFKQVCGVEFPSTVWAQLKGCVEAVFRSWGSTRAVEYRKHNTGNFGQGTAVTVQWMFPSEVSGVVFTRPPSEPWKDEILIESAFGLGEAVVSGDAEPDHFVLSRNTLEVLSAREGDKANVVLALGAAVAPSAGFSLTNEQLAELGELSLRIERSMGVPQDIEFGFDGKSFGLLQCRPIRGIDSALEAARMRAEEIKRLEAAAGGKERTWVTHNLGETLPFPTPLTWDVIRYFMSGAGGMGELYRRFGYSYRDEKDAEFLELICGRIYADPDLTVRLLWHGLPVVCDMRGLEDDLSRLENPPVRFDPEGSDRMLLFHLPVRLFSIWRAGRAQKRLRRDAVPRFQSEVLPEFLRYIEEQRRTTLKDLNDFELLALLDSRRRTVMREFACESLIPGFIGAIELAALSSRLVGLLGLEQGQALTRMLVSGSSPTTTRQREMLYSVASGDIDLAEFLKEFGHRSTREMELASPRWIEDPAYLVQAVSRLKSPSYSASDDAQAREAEQNLEQVLREHGASSFCAEIKAQAARARGLLQYRETGKHYLMLGYKLIRDVLLELDDRWGMEGRIFFLHWDEVMKGRETVDGVRPDLTARSTRHEAMKRISIGDVITTSSLGQLGVSDDVPGGNSEKGIPVSGGVATGVVCIVKDPSAAPDLPDNCILVCPSTDPGWMPLLVNAAGLIVERGGVLSHGALIARDLGIPAVVCKGVTASMKDGEHVRIDGFRGLIETLSEGGAN